MIRALLFFLAFAIAIPAASIERVLSDVALPKNVSLPAREVVALVLPDLARKAARPREVLPNGQPDSTDINEAAVSFAELSSVGARRTKYLVVVVHEIDRFCDPCQSTHFAVIDPARARVMGSFATQGIPKFMEVSSSGARIFFVHHLKLNEPVFRIDIRFVWHGPTLELVHSEPVISGAA